jgi:hypothetical protein
MTMAFLESVIQAALKDGTSNSYQASACQERKR